MRPGKLSPSIIPFPPCQVWKLGLAHYVYEPACVLQVELEAKLNISSKHQCQVHSLQNADSLLFRPSLECWHKPICHWHSSAMWHHGWQQWQTFQLCTIRTTTGLQLTPVAPPHWNITLERVLMKATRWVRPVRNDFSQCKTLSDKPQPSSLLHNRIWWSTVPNTTFISKSSSSMIHLVSSAMARSMKAHMHAVWKLRFLSTATAFSRGLNCCVWPDHHLHMLQPTEAAH